MPWSSSPPWSMHERVSEVQLQWDIVSVRLTPTARNWVNSSHPISSWLSDSLPEEFMAFHHRAREGKSHWEFTLGFKKSFVLLMYVCRALVGTAQHCSVLGAASPLPAPYLEGPLHGMVALNPVPTAWKQSLPPAASCAGHSLPTPVSSTTQLPFWLR